MIYQQGLKYFINNQKKLKKEAVVKYFESKLTSEYPYSFLLINHNIIYLLIYTNINNFTSKNILKLYPYLKPILHQRKVTKVLRMIDSLLIYHLIYLF